MMAYSHSAQPPTTMRREAGAPALAMPRRRGTGTGFLLLLLGIWGGIIPFVGPLFGYAADTAGAWSFTLDRLWLGILPGVAVIIGGLLMMCAADRLTASVASWFSVAGGAWFLVGPSFALLWGSTVLNGTIATQTGAQRFIEQIGMFYGLGAVVIGLSAATWARVTVRSERDERLLEASGRDRVAVRPEPTAADTASRAEQQAPAAPPQTDDHPLSPESDSG